MSKKANFFAIGVFVVIASVIAGLSLILLGSGKLTKHTADLLVTFRGSANGLLVGAKVKTYGVEIGTVKSIMLHREEGTDEIVIPVLLEIDLTHLSGLMGYKDTLTMSGAFFDYIQESGACAKLQVESLVTGLLYVELELGVEQQGYVLKSERFADYHALPTVRTDMERMFASLQQIVENLGSTDFSGLVEETKGTMTDLRADLNRIDLPALSQSLDALLEESRRMVGNPDLAKAFEDLGVAMTSFRDITETVSKGAGGTMQVFNESMLQMQGTLKQLEAASASARVWLDPSSALYQEVILALDQISDAARSLRVLIDYVERNPNSLITGRSTGETQP